MIILKQTYIVIIFINLKPTERMGRRSIFTKNCIIKIEYSAYESQSALLSNDLKWFIQRCKLDIYTKNCILFQYFVGIIAIIYFLAPFNSF